MAVESDKRDALRRAEDILSNVGEIEAILNDRNTDIEKLKLAEFTGADADQVAARGWKCGAKIGADGKPYLYCEYSW